MCGIFGIHTTSATSITTSAREAVLRKLYVLSESRGKESAGLHAVSQTLQRTLKSAVAAHKFIHSRAYRALMRELGDQQAATLIAHSRLVTNGSAAQEQNNQPVNVGRVTIVHNGIIVNDRTLWDMHPDLQRRSEVDTEVAAAVLNMRLEQGDSPIAAMQYFFGAMQGAASIAWVTQGSNQLHLGTNTGDLYVTCDHMRNMFLFASEEYILREVLRAVNPEAVTWPPIRWLKPGALLSVDLTTLAIDEGEAPLSQPHAPLHFPVVLNQPADESLLRYNAKNLEALTRCTKCVLPETFPFIHFDAHGVCNYCHGYQPKYAGRSREQAIQEFRAAMEHYRREGGKPDAIVPFSGGRDSCYGLHLIKKEFGFTPVTFTYDWGMVTDLARRNIARMCGQLGVQNILVSADIKTKRDNIRRNVSAWLKKPDLGLVPLFMAGDKHFFPVTNQLKAQTGIDLNIWCANPLENTDFKSGFCGVAPDFDKHRVDYLSLKRKLTLLAYYGRGYLQNPSYFNRSLVDTFSAFQAYYFEQRRDFYSMFHHLHWNEDEVNQTLLNEYGFETSPDSPSTWRIGDGTAPFYNYIYVTANGFSEFDTFRSNQIREGQISREEALQHVLRENAPRVESLRWYLETIGVDFNAAIGRINRLDTRGLHA